ncbi:uncharacterized protein MKK02DRAFT_45431 [Dioszegia hungarica]|uniref:SMP-30/Gluconolactonase/LRE-like region domain-containing protein n=1 Tax=Dioszegia hungarica TaxID=4972 RepID=A0AA38HAM3_9TREE|nr:uncharacterized protein MKK02DRAFT_45431 [Dioszegia hungarica]KAI9636726.1 hypothetical protein MKK02DRAFT_45431 [Dioszegia hungarica]
MTGEIPVIQAERELACGNTLGEGILWDDQKKLLHWVDIDEAEIHTYDPESKKYGVDSYKSQTKYLSAIALRKDEPGFIGLTQHHIAFFSEPTAPSGTDTRPERSEREAELLSAPVAPEAQTDKPLRFNDGQCDPLGRFYAGSMTLPELGDGKKRGKLWRYDPDGTQTEIIPAVGTSNGIGYSPDGKIMYYVDSADQELVSFDYSSGSLASRKVIATTPPPLAPATDAPGVFDGLCMDGVGNIWVARWSDGRVVGYTPEGEIICNINVPGARNVTIPCFGGKNMETMYINTAHAGLGKGGEDAQKEYPHSGDLFKVDFSAGSEIRKLLSDDWKPADRHRFGG